MTVSDATPAGVPAVTVKFKTPLTSVDPRSLLGSGCCHPGNKAERIRQSRAHTAISEDLQVGIGRDRETQ